MRSRPVALPIAVLAVALLGACGNVPESERPTISTGVAPSSVAGQVTASSTAPTSTVVKPEVKLPSSTPTALGITTITPGTGDPAKAGDILVVDYVGVTSDTGEMFDNSYDRGKPIAVAPLGKAQVIPGWNQGLVGATKGERLQLDIPSELAYGEQGQGQIKPGEAISFVIDVRQVIDPGTADQAPKITVAKASPRPDLKIEELVPGTGDVVADGKTVVLQLLVYRADTGAQVISTWQQGQPISFVYGKDQLLKGIVEGVKGMKVGGRRQVDVPFAQGFGTAGSEQLGIPGSTDVVFVIDLIAVY